MIIEEMITAPQGGELTLQRANLVAVTSASVNPSQPPPTGMQLAQFSTQPPPAGMQSAQVPGQGEGGPLQKEGQASTKITVSQNKFTDTVTSAFNNTYRPNHNFEGEYTKCEHKGGSVSIGNGAPYPGSYGHS